MNLLCMTPIEIGFIISLYFFGYGLGIFLSFLPDKIGRKTSVLMSLTVALVSETVMVFNANYNVRCAGYFIIGLFQIQNSTSYLWISESVATPYKPTTHAVISSVYSLP